MFARLRVERVDDGFEDLTSYARSLKRIKEEFESYKRLGVSENGANSCILRTRRVPTAQVDAYIKHRVSRETSS